jgi:MoxR-vWA-beta-propeller ternary system domain bpX2
MCNNRSMRYGKKSFIQPETIIMKEWIFQLSKDDHESLGTVRCMPGLQAAVEEDRIWLRGLIANGDPDSSLSKLPLRKTFLLDGQHNLFLAGAATPIAKLPELIWQPVASFVSVEAPVSSLPGKINDSISLRLKTTTEEQPGVALLTSLNSWKSYAEKAPAVRLKNLRFAVSENDEVFITGKPLPPLPGREYWNNENLLLPSGYDFEISIVAKLVSQRLHAGTDDVILFDTDASWQCIPASCFIKATRSAIRLTRVNPTND